MLELNFLRKDKERVLEGLRKKNLPADQLAMVDEILALDIQRKSLQTLMDNGLNQVNSLSKEIGNFMKSGQTAEAENAKNTVSGIKEKNKEIEEQLKLIQNKQETLLLSLPNLPHSSVPNGKVAEDNEVFQDWPVALPVLPDSAKPHWELAQDYDIFDMELGVKISGSGFILYRRNGARLQRALINFFLEEANSAGYEEVWVPLLVNKETAFATGQLPDKEGQMYYAEKDDLYLIPTAEVPVTNIYRNEILKESDLPVCLTAYTPCFRREAGSYGAHVKGLNRVHQFDKIEIVRIEHPDNSYRALELMLDHVRSLLAKLELPYRILKLCGGDMSFSSALTYDFEVYSAAQKRWLEVSSVSNFETFQTNRMKLRYKNKDGQIQLLHTLNGSALALARIVAAILENHQTDKGIRIPLALQKYFGSEYLCNTQI
ncbi:MAG: serine--tRNA ligase [Saprospiraceae bacterium]|nr:serine--tRNA ligase [Saprospiraceae bacterium]